MSPVSLEVRELLVRSQNADGGWGYVPGKRSWLEPTAYAYLALKGSVGAEGAARRARTRLLGWQRADGGWAPHETVKDSTWVTALAVRALAAEPESDAGAVRRGVAWLTGARGAESSWTSRAAAMVGLVDRGRDPLLTGWPWVAGTTSWVEPTAHALAALRRAGGGAEAAERAEMGTRQMWSLRCADGGWNYGAPRALEIALPSYPETTALALVGLAGTRHAKLAEVVAHAWRLTERPLPAMASAWLAIALRLHGAEPAREVTAPGAEADVTTQALYLLSAVEGNWRLVGGAQ